MKHMNRRVAKDKQTGIHKKYLSGIKGEQRRELSAVLKRISALYRAGKTIPSSLIRRRIELGKNK